MSHQLDVFQALGGAMGLPGEALSVSQMVEKIGASEFAGIDIPCLPEYYDLRNEALQTLPNTDLDLSLCVFASGTAVFQETLEIADKFRDRVRFINMIPDLQPWSVSECADQIQNWLEMGKKAGIPVYIETHRMSPTQDLYFTLQLMDALPEMGMIADLSHLMVSAEFTFPPLTEEQQGLIQRILDRAESFQGRVASAQQVQLPLGFPQHQVWEEIFKDWWKRGFASWRKRHRDNPEARLVFMPELLEPPYAITDAQGNELSDRWQDALTLKNWVEQLWSETQA